MTLRRRNKDEFEKTNDLESLLVFGYQCKVFRDDERAMFIDRGQHLIPWMGDSSIMIDRYDGRGHLYDLRPYDAESVDSHSFVLSEKERAVEKACDEERYLELRTDILEKQMYEEEEMKRLYEAVGEDGGYAAVGFNYDQAVQPAQPQPEVKEEEEEDDPYEPIPELQVPKGVNLPPTMKMHAIIEKTAAFISTQGSQMEIVIAAKQKNNPQFGFLNFGHELNVYYKHMIRMIQKGKYKAKPQEAYAKKRTRKSSEGLDSQEHGYLHPSLGGKQQEETEPPAKFLESVTAKLPTGQIANTAYAKLLNNLSKHTGRNSPQPHAKQVQRTPVESKKDDAQVGNANNLKPPPVPGFVGHETSHGNPPEVPVSDPVTVPGPNQPPPPGTEPVQPPAHAHYDPHYQHGYEYSQYYPHYGEAQYDYAGYYGPHYGHYGGYPHDHYPAQPEAEDSGSGIHGNAEASEEVKKDVARETKPEPEVPETQPGQGAPTHEDSDDELNLPDHITVPSREVRPIIDKMAVYVVRNGADFELMMRKKNDERFRFLNSWHPHHSYYEYKREKLRREANGEPEPDYSSSLDPGAAKSVSFSIKAKENDTPSVAKKRSFLADTDDEEERHNDVTETSHDVSAAESESSVSEKKQAEESLKNKLAVAAREKLATVKEEGKLRAERKKKAAMFAALLQKNPNENESTSLSRISSVASLTSLPGGNTSRSNSPMPSALISGASSLANTPPPSDKRVSPERTESPGANVITQTLALKRSKSRSSSSSSSSSSPPRKSKRHTKSRSRSKSRSRVRRSKHYRHSRSKRSRSRSRRPRSRSRSRRSRSGSRHRRKSPYLPSAYSVMRRSLSPRSKRRKSRSPSPSRHKRSKHRRSRSRSRRSRSKSASRRKRRSRSKSKSRLKSKKSKKSKRSHRKSTSRKKGKMVPIPELTPPPEVEKIIVSSETSDSEQGEKDAKSAQNGAKDDTVDKSTISSRKSSRSSSPDHTSEGEIKSPKPSEDLLVKVRAMLQAHKEILDGD